MEPTKEKITIPTLTPTTTLTPQDAILCPYCGNSMTYYGRTDVHWIGEALGSDVYICDRSTAHALFATVMDSFTPYTPSPTQGRQTLWDRLRIFLREHFTT